MPGAELATRLGLPIILENTARLSLLAEARRGAGVGRRDIAYVKLSSGVGGGFLVDGRVVRGAVGAAGEIGHITVVPGGRLCRCGDRGCLEAYASVPSILESVRPVLGDADLPALLRALAEGDRSAQRAFADVGHMVGSAMANTANLFNPEAVIVGGELADAGDALLGPIAEAIRGQSLRLVGETLEVLPAELGVRSAALGAVALVLHEEDNLTVPAARPEEGMVGAQ
jgi:predicted NBD/HSP70 family sugar kinase